MWFQCLECGHEFQVSFVRLLLARSFRGRNPIPTGTAYHLKCPKCGKKSWLTPIQQKIIDRSKGEAKRRGKTPMWRRFWPLTIISCLVLIVVQCILYLLGYVDLSQLCCGILLVFVAIPLAYGVRYLQIRYLTSNKMQLINKIAFIMAGAFLAPPFTLFATAFIIWATGLSPPTDYLGAWSTLILLFVVPCPVGGYIGYRIGKRRNYRPYV